MLLSHKMYRDNIMKLCTYHIACPYYIIICLFVLFN